MQFNRYLPLATPTVQGINKATEVNILDFDTSLGNGGLTDALSRLGTTDPATLSIATPVTITSSVTIPPNISPRLAHAGLINLSPGVTLTISGFFDAPIKQVFGTGTTGQGPVGGVQFTFGAAREVYPEWWGARGDGVVNANFQPATAKQDNSAEFQAAINSIPSIGGGKIRCVGPTYNFQYPITVMHITNYASQEGILIEGSVSAYTYATNFESLVLPNNSHQNSDTTTFSEVAATTFAWNNPMDNVSPLLVMWGRNNTVRGIFFTTNQGCKSRVLVDLDKNGATPSPVMVQDTVTHSASITTTGNIPAGTHTYSISRVQYGVETKMSTGTSVTTTAPTKARVLFPTYNTIDHNATHKNIYRTVNTFQYFGSIPAVNGVAAFKVGDTITLGSTSVIVAARTVSGTTITDFQIFPPAVGTNPPLGTVASPITTVTPPGGSQITGLTLVGPAKKITFPPISYLTSVGSTATIGGVYDDAGGGNNTGSPETATVLSVTTTTSSVVTAMSISPTTHNYVGSVQVNGVAANVPTHNQSSLFFRLKTMGTPTTPLGTTVNPLSAPVPLDVDGSTPVAFDPTHPEASYYFDDNVSDAALFNSGSAIVGPVPNTRIARQMAFETCAIGTPAWGVGSALGTANIGIRQGLAVLETNLDFFSWKDTIFGNLTPTQFITFAPATPLPLAVQSGVPYMPVGSGAKLTDPVNGTSEIVRIYSQTQANTNTTIATVVVAATSCEKSVVTSQGSGYLGSDLPDVTISAPDVPVSAGGVQATATLTVSGGLVTGLSFTELGSGYLKPPTVTLSSGHPGTGAVISIRVGQGPFRNTYSVANNLTLTPYINGTLGTAMNISTTLASSGTPQVPNGTMAAGTMDPSGIGLYCPNGSFQSVHHQLLNCYFHGTVSTRSSPAYISTQYGTYFWTGTYLATNTVFYQIKTNAFFGTTLQPVRFEGADSEQSGQMLYVTGSDQPIKMSGCRFAGLSIPGLLASGNEPIYVGNGMLEMDSCQFVGTTPNSNMLSVQNVRVGSGSLVARNCIFSSMDPVTTNVTTDQAQVELIGCRIQQGGINPPGTNNSTVSLPRSQLTMPNAVGTGFLNSVETGVNFNSPVDIRPISIASTTPTTFPNSPAPSAPMLNTTPPTFDVTTPGSVDAGWHMYTFTRATVSLTNNVVQRQNALHVLGDAEIPSGVTGTFNVVSPSTVYVVAPLMHHLNDKFFNFYRSKANYTHTVYVPASSGLTVSNITTNGYRVTIDPGTNNADTVIVSSPTLASIYNTNDYITFTTGPLPSPHSNRSTIGVGTNVYPVESISNPPMYFVGTLLNGNNGTFVDNVPDSSLGTAGYPVMPYQGHLGSGPPNAAMATTSGNQYQYVPLSAIIPLSTQTGSMTTINTGMTQPYASSASDLVVGSMVTLATGTGSAITSAGPFPVVGIVPDSYVSTSMTGITAIILGPTATPTNPNGGSLLTAGNTLSWGSSGTATVAAGATTTTSGTFGISTIAQYLQYAYTLVRQDPSNNVLYESALSPITTSNLSIVSGVSATKGASIAPPPTLDPTIVGYHVYRYNSGTNIFAGGVSLPLQHSSFFRVTVTPVPKTATFVDMVPLNSGGSAGLNDLGLQLMPSASYMYKLSASGPSPTASTTGYIGETPFSQVNTTILSTPGQVVVWTPIANPGITHYNIYRMRGNFALGGDLLSPIGAMTSGIPATLALQPFSYIDSISTLKDYSTSATSAFFHGMYADSWKSSEHDYVSSVFPTVPEPTATQLPGRTTSANVGTTVNSTTLTYASGDLGVFDTGAVVTHANLLPGTSIVAVVSPTVAILSSPAIATGSSLTVTIAQLSPYQTAARSVTDAVTNSSTTITSATANFTALDVGAAITVTGTDTETTNTTGIPAAAKIASVTNSTTAVLTNAATANKTTVHLIITPSGIISTSQVASESLSIAGGGARISGPVTLPDVSGLSTGRKTGLLVGPDITSSQGAALALNTKGLTASTGPNALEIYDTGGVLAASWDNTGKLTKAIVPPALIDVSALAPGGSDVGKAVVANYSGGAYTPAWGSVSASATSLVGIGTATTYVPTPTSTGFSVATNTVSGSSVLGTGTYSWAYSWVNSAGQETGVSPLVTKAALTFGVNTDALITVPALPTNAVSWNLYRTTSTGSALFLVTNQSGTTYIDNIPDTTLQGTPKIAPTYNTTVASWPEMVDHGAAHASGGTDDIYSHVGSMSPLRLETIPRLNIAAVGSNSVTVPVVGTMTLTYAKWNMPGPVGHANGFIFNVGATAVNLGSGLLWLSLWAYDGNNLQLIAQTDGTSLVTTALTVNANYYIGSGYASLPAGTNTLSDATHGLLKGPDGTTITTFPVRRGQAYYLGYHTSGTTTSQGTLRGINYVLGANGYMSLTPSLAASKGSMASPGASNPITVFTATNSIAFYLALSMTGTYDNSNAYV